MKRPYLLGFVRNCNTLPSEPPLSPEITTLGEHSVIWCKSPKEIFTKKQDFLMAMLLWFEQIRHLGLTVLPVQSGVSVSNKDNLEKLLRTYQKELDYCFDRVQETAEYCLTIPRENQDFARLEYSGLRKNVQTGKEYLERVRVYHQQREKEMQKAQEVVNCFRLRLAPWIKDYWKETLLIRGGELNLGFLVPNTCKEEFINELETLLQELNVPNEWTGPWLPFHFSSLSLKPESYLIHEVLNWEERRVTS